MGHTDFQLQLPIDLKSECCNGRMPDQIVGIFIHCYVDAKGYLQMIMNTNNIDVTKRHLPSTGVQLSFKLNYLRVVVNNIVFIY